MSEINRTATTPAAFRSMPGTSRTRRPALLAISLLLAAGGATATVLLKARASERTDVIEISQQIEPGQPIPLTAMKRSQMAPGTGAFVPWSQQAHLGGKVTTVPILPGTLLTESMIISAASEHVTGRALVGLDLKPGQIPGGLEPGSRVRIVHTPEASSNRQGQVLVESALVESINVREDEQSSIPVDQDF